MLPTLIAVFSLAIVSLLLTSYVLYFLLRRSTRSNFSKAILYLHVTQVIDVISSLPNIYSNDDSLCAFIGFLHYYSGLANVCSGAAINIVLYRSLFVSEGFDSLAKYLKYWHEIFVFVFPLLTILPFSTGSYGNTIYDDDVSLGWCSMKRGNVGTGWAFGVLYAWVWLILFSSSCCFTLVLYRVYRTYSDLAPKLIKLFGIYPLVLACSWSMRSMRRITMIAALKLEPSSFYNIPIYISGIVYFCVFLTKYEVWKEYEERMAPVSNVLDVVSNKLNEDEHPYQIFI